MRLSQHKWAPHPVLRRATYGALNAGWPGCMNNQSSARRLDAKPIDCQMGNHKYWQRRIAMRSVVLALLFLAPSSTFAAQSEKVCLLRERVKITEVNGAIELAGRSPRLTSIRVSLPIHCKSGATLVPRDTTEAVAWLDASLPLDLKASLLHGDYAEPYATTNYGASVMEDLFHHYSSRWTLKDGVGVCNSPDVKRRIASDAGPCFYALIDILRGTYLKGADRL